jgi:uncharacterized protein YjbI with pentapeptide repeats
MVELENAVTSAGLDRQLIAEVSATSVRTDRNLDLSNLDLSGAQLAGGIFVTPDGSVDYSAGRLAGADLRRTDLRGATFEGVDLSFADLRGADLRGADLHDLYFELPNPISSDDLTLANLSGALADRNTRWPRGFDWRAAGVMMMQP